MKRACRVCKKLTSEKKCPVCGSTEFESNWKGLVIVFDPDNSEIAKKIGVKLPGEYALKLR